MATQAFDPYYNKASSTASPEGEAEEIGQRYFEKPAFTTGYPYTEAMPSTSNVGTGVGGTTGKAFDPSAMTQPFSGFGGSGQGGGVWSPAMQSIGNLAVSLGKEGASYASGGASIFSPWNQAASTAMDAASSFGGAMVGGAINMGIGYGSAPLWFTSTLGQFPILGSIVGSMLWPEKDPESPYQYYDPKTRGYAQGIQKGEPLNQFDAASSQYSAVKSALDERMTKQYAGQYGIKNLTQTRDMPGDFGVPFGSSEGASDEVLNMLNDIYGKAGGIENFLNPTEQNIFKNYNTLFNKEITGGGPSPYMEYLASQGR